MSIQDKMDKIKEQLTELRKISKFILAANETIEGRQGFIDIIEQYRIFDDSSWDGFGRFRHAMQEIYNKHDPKLVLPKFQCDTYGLDRQYTQEHGYLLLEIDASNEYNPITLIGFAPLFESYKENTKEHTLESTYTFIMDCVEYILDVSRKMLCLPIFKPNEVVFLSLVCHYYFDYKFEAHPNLNYVHSMTGAIYDDFKRMVFETDGAHPLSVRGNLAILSHYARKKNAGHYRWHESDPSSFVRDMRSNKALNIRKVFDKMENLLDWGPGMSYEERDKKISFVCTVGIQTQAPHYDRRKRLPGISTKPVATFSDSVKLGILSTCMEPDSSSFDERYVGWIGFKGGVSIYDRYERIFNCLEDNIVNTLEDNYNFLLEKLSGLNEKALRNDVLNYIIEGR